MTEFTGLRVHQVDNGVEARLDTLTLDDLSAGEVVIRVAWSSINYKDALAATGAGKILRSYPLVAGVDASGVVVSSDTDRLKPGDRVVVNGCGLSETRDGGLAEFVRVPADFPSLVPDSMSLRQAMQIGTAGFTAALAIDRMEHNGQRPELGPVLVNGATGGVGSVAVDLLSARGYSVTALTSKPDESGDYLRELGAGEVLDARNLDMGSRPLEKAVWGGGIDNLGGDVLGWMTRTTVPQGNIAAIGLAAGFKLETTVMPFILRGVNLLGINSVDQTLQARQNIWNRLAGDLTPRHLDSMTTAEVALADILPAFPPYIEGRVTGRTVVKVSGEG